MSHSDYGDPGTATLIGQPEPEVQLLSPDSGSIRVEVVGGPMDGECGRAERNDFVIGRDDTNDLSLALDPRVSKRHARILKEGEHFWLEDLGSSNGSFLGDEKIRGRALIGPGTMFVLGSTALEFMPD